MATMTLNFCPLVRSSPQQEPHHDRGSYPSWRPRRPPRPRPRTAPERRGRAPGPPSAPAPARPASKAEAPPRAASSRRPCPAPPRRRPMPPSCLSRRWGVRCERMGLASPLYLLCCCHAKTRTDRSRLLDRPTVTPFFACRPDGAVLEATDVSPNLLQTGPFLERPLDGLLERSRLADATQLREDGPPRPPFVDQPPQPRFACQGGHKILFAQ